jgi:hypothetical protein
MLFHADKKHFMAIPYAMPVMKCLVAVVSAQRTLSMKYVTKATRKGEQKSRGWVGMHHDFVEQLAVK